MKILFLAAFIGSASLALADSNPYQVLFGHYAPVASNPPECGGTRISSFIEDIPGNPGKGFQIRTSIGQIDNVFVIGQADRGCTNSFKPLVKSHNWPKSDDTYAVFDHTCVDADGSLIYHLGAGFKYAKGSNKIESVAWETYSPVYE